jgi:hypothetical protein
LIKEKRNGNCEKGSGQEGRGEEGSGEEGRGEEGSGEEGRSQEGSGEEGRSQESCEEARCEEGPGCGSSCCSAREDRTEPSGRLAFPDWQQALTGLF